MAAGPSSTRLNQLHNLCVGKSMFSQTILAFDILVPHWDSDKKKRVQCGLDEIFADMNDVFCYLQYVIIATNDKKTTLDLVVDVFEKIEIHQMKVRAEKTKIGFKCFEYDGAMISDQGITLTKTNSKNDIAWFMNMDNYQLSLHVQPDNDPNDINAPKQSRLATISSLNEVTNILNENKFQVEFLQHLPTISQMEKSAEKSIVYFIERKYIPNQVMNKLLASDPRFNQIFGLFKYKARTLEFFKGELTKLKLVSWLNPSKECLVCYEDIDSSPLSPSKRGVVGCSECGVELCNVCVVSLCLKNFKKDDYGMHMFECPKCGFDKNGVFMPAFCLAMIEDKFLKEFEEKEQKFIHFMAKKAPRYKSVCKNKKNKNQNKKKNIKDKNENKKNYKVNAGHCGFCTKKLNKPKKQRQRCKICNKVFYCRAKCRRLHYKQHQNQCQK